MVQTLPFGPFSLPTGPVMAMVAAWLGLELASRYGRRLHLRSDDVWNTGMLALLAGLIVARLWNVVQFWYIYVEEPRLVFSLRPSGFVLWPGLIAALIAGYAYLLRKAMDPLRTAAAFAIGTLAFLAVVNGSRHLTGALLGAASDLPWALDHFGVSLHPVALYRALGLLLWLAALWVRGNPQRPRQLLLLAGLGYTLVILVTEAFVAEPVAWAGLRRDQVLALLAALALTVLLAQDEASFRRTVSESPTAPPAQSES